MVAASAGFALRGMSDVDFSRIKKRKDKKPIGFLESVFPATYNAIYGKLQKDNYYYVRRK